MNIKRELKTIQNWLNKMNNSFSVVVFDDKRGQPIVFLKRMAAKIGIGAAKSDCTSLKAIDILDFDL